MSASTWAPLMPYLGPRRLIAFDLPVFGLSDPFDYGGRPLRSHAVAQLTSLFDALDLERVPIVGTSLGGMWALCLALNAPNRVAASRHSVSRPSRCPALQGDPAFTALSPPSCARSSRGSGRPPWRYTPDDGWRCHRPSGRRESPRKNSSRSSTRASASLAFGPQWSPTCNSRCGSGDPAQRTSSQTPNCDSSPCPLLMIWGDEDPFGGPEIGQRARALMPNARLEVPGRHAAFLDDAERCCGLIERSRSPSQLT